MTCVVPGPDWNKSTLPPLPTFTVTAFGIVAPPPDQFRFDAVGRATPVGKTVKNPPDVVSVTVTFSTTADTPDAGTPPTPVTCTATTTTANNNPNDRRTESPRRPKTPERKPAIQRPPETSHPAVAMTPNT